MPRAPSKSSQGDTLVPRSVPGVAAVTPAQRNDAKPVLLWVGSGRWPQGFTPGGGGNLLGKGRGSPKSLPPGLGGTVGCSIP